MEVMVRCWMWRFSCSISAERLQIGREKKSPSQPTCAGSQSGCFFFFWFSSPSPSLCPPNTPPLPSFLLFLLWNKQVQSGTRVGNIYMSGKREGATRATVGRRERRKKRREGQRERGRGEGFQWVKRGRRSQSTPALLHTATDRWADVLAS